MRIAILFLSLVLASCGEAVRDDHFTNAVDPAASAPAAEATTEVPPLPVRVGEMGSSFAACTTAGTTRQVDAGGALPVRAAPFDRAAQSGAVAAAGRFFICSRSIDQRWFGIVWDEAADGLAARCGVSSPLPGRQNYTGPCRSGWVQSAFVKVIAG